MPRLRHIIAAAILLPIVGCGPHQPTQSELQNQRIDQGLREQQKLNQLYKAVVIQKLRAQGYTIPAGVE